MSKSIGCIGLMFFLIVSCGKGVKVPSNVIQPEDMEKILFELNMAEDFVMTYIAKDTTKNRDAEIKMEYHKVFMLHGVNEQQFEESYDFYKKNPDIFRVVMDSLNAKAQRKRNEIYATPMR